MSLSTNLQDVATRLIDKFGDSSELIDITTGSYDPTTGTTADTSVTITLKAYIKPVKQEEYSRYPELLGKASSVATVAYMASLDAMDNSWKINNHSIHKIMRTTTQDNTIVIKVYF